VQSHRLSEHIITHASHLHCVWSEELATVHEATSLKGHWVVSLVHYQHPNQTLISINNEVAAKLMRVFLSLDKKLFGEAVKIAVLRADHNWNFPYANVYFLWVLVVYTATQRGVEGRLVSQRALTTLCWVDLLLFMLTAHNKSMSSTCSRSTWFTKLKRLEPHSVLGKGVGSRRDSSRWRVLFSRLISYLNWQHIGTNARKTLLNSVVEGFDVMR